MSPASLRRIQSLVDLKNMRQRYPEPVEQSSFPRGRSITGTQWARRIMTVLHKVDGVSVVRLESYERRSSAGGRDA